MNLLGKLNHWEADTEVNEMTLPTPHVGKIQTEEKPSHKKRKLTSRGKRSLFYYAIN